MYFDYNKILSYNAMFNFLIGSRGIGKTYGISKFVINQYLKKNEEFAYIRRYKTELKKSIPSFFSSIIENKLFPNNSFSVNNNKFICDKNIFGHAMTLSTAQDLKSSNFDKVKTIIFDEFGIEEGQRKFYLQNEVFAFLGLIETIARMRDVRVFFLSNAVSRTNPYFLFFDLNVPYDTDIKLYKNGLILVNYIKSDDYINAKKQTRFGQLVAGTSYSDYAIDNKFINESMDFIQKKSGSCKFLFAFISNHQTFGVWFNQVQNIMFVSNDWIHNTPFLFSTALDDHNSNTIYLSANKKYTVWKKFIKYYELGRLRFENVKIKNLCYKLIKSLC